ncbi:LppP/LprE family lipoprotein [Nocardia sp. CS682]|uniref:LppP/LprE family lipoprotein n=1 Tax=Nocardia sp. CS682 TaxID=1047172 RepID=UPI001075002A|nr:LppP/LprE family lipoprotein [Nocardia sp. CS682]QBS45073.1 LppP/LprE family lipoprotein [Nocardia sp. CS682]
MVRIARPVFVVCAGIVVAVAGCAADGDSGSSQTRVRNAAPTTSGAPVRCGVDLSAPVIQSAIAALPAEPVTHAPWSTDPRGFEGNFDPCATLSAVIITVQGATGSSPNHALLFHKGAYIGTATPQAHGFTSLDVDRTTDDTVGLAYKTPGSCNACPDGTVTHVQFRWEGQKVRMIGTPPK